MSTPDILKKILQTKQEEIALRAKTRSLAQLRAQAELAQMRVLQRGNRLSITPVDEEEWHCITALVDR